MYNCVRKDVGMLRFLVACVLVVVGSLMILLGRRAPLAPFVYGRWKAGKGA